MSLSNSNLSKADTASSIAFLCISSGMSADLTTTRGWREAGMLLGFVEDCGGICSSFTLPAGGAVVVVIFAV